MVEINNVIYFQGDFCEFTGRLLASSNRKAMKELADMEDVYYMSGKYVSTSQKSSHLNQFSYNN